MSSTRRETLADLPRLSGFKTLTQISVITADIETTTSALERCLYPGHFKMLTLDAPQLFHRTYSGEPSDWSAKVGLTWIGGIQLEIIQPMSGRTVYKDYLDRTGRQHGIEHIFLERDADSYEATLKRLSQAGYPLVQQAQMNAAGKLGIMPMPALPDVLAGKLATRFGYTRSFDALKIDLEVAKFPPGVTQRLALRAAIPERWIPEGAPHRFEDLPSDAFLADLDGLGILCEDLDAVVAAFGKLVDRALQLERYADDPWPGRGRMTRLGVGDVLLLLIQPDDGVLAERLAEHGEGVQLVRARPTKVGLKGVQEALTTRGWALLSRAPVVVAEHPEVPFLLWLERE